MANYLEKLRDPRWQKKRLEILERDKFACTLCGDKETELHVHHSGYKGEPWETPDVYLETNCKHCHFIQEFLKHNYPYDKIVAVRKVPNILSKHPFIIVEIGLKSSINNKPLNTFLIFNTSGGDPEFVIELHQSQILAMYEMINNY